MPTGTLLSTAWLLFVHNLVAINEPVTAGAGVILTG